MDTRTVLPSTPVKEQTIKLSLCDAYSPKLWVTQTHFWPTSTTSQPFEASLKALHHGLARTLSEIPALGGTIGRTSDDSRDAVINVDKHSCLKLLFEDHTNNRQIQSYAELKASGFPVTGLAVPFSDEAALRPVAVGSPLLLAKLNKLQGGLALTFAFNHLLADATTVAAVERVWAAHTADISAGLSQRIHKIDSDDVLARVRLSVPPTDTVAQFEDPNWTIFPTAQSQLGLPDQVASGEAAALILQKAKEEHWASMKTSIDSPQWCMWHFTPEALVQLKKDCSAALPSGQWISTIDAVVGLFWSRLACLKRTDRGNQRLSKLCFPINLRARLEPAINPAYLGNAVDILACDVKLDDLEQPGAQGWATAALTVRAAVAGWRQDRWESWLAVVKDLPPDQALCPNPLMLLDHMNMAFNDYSRSDSNTLDWGKDFGRVERTRYMKPAGTMKGCATGVVVHPRLADGGLEVASTTTKDLCRSMQDDEVFRRYTKLTCAFA